MNLTCPRCLVQRTLESKYLGQLVRCPACAFEFFAEDPAGELDEAMVRAFRTVPADFKASVPDDPMADEMIQQRERYRSIVAPTVWRLKAAGCTILLLGLVFDLWIFCWLLPEMRIRLGPCFWFTVGMLLWLVQLAIAAPFLNSAKSLSFGRSRVFLMCMVVVCWLFAVAAWSNAGYFWYGTDVTNLAEYLPSIVSGVIFVFAGVVYGWTGVSLGRALSHPEVRSFFQRRNA